VNDAEMGEMRRVREKNNCEIVDATRVGKVHTKNAQ